MDAEHQQTRIFLNLYRLIAGYEIELINYQAIGESNCRRYLLCRQPKIRQFPISDRRGKRFVLIFEGGIPAAFDGMTYTMLGKNRKYLPDLSWEYS